MSLDSRVKFLAAGCTTLVGGIILYDRVPDVFKPLVIAATAAVIGLEAYLCKPKNERDRIRQYLRNSPQVTPLSDNGIWKHLKDLYNAARK